MSSSDRNNLDAILRLLTYQHRFGCPEIAIDRKTPVSFVNAFRSCGMPHIKSSAILTQADAARIELSSALVTAQRSNTPAWESVSRGSEAYVPLISQILVSCQAQPGMARLDQRLTFGWSSGLEKQVKNKMFFKSEALVYDLVMTLACNVMANAGLAYDSCTANDFTAASRNFKKAASILEYLAEDQLPRWVVAGGISDLQLPSEATIGICDGFKTYFLALGQQMAIATLLAKSDTPNYTLVSKLCLGTAELLEQCMAIIKSRASNQMPRIDPNFLSLVTFQTSMQRSLSSFFLARSFWEAEDYGIAIALLKEAMSGLQKLPLLGSAYRSSKQDMAEVKDNMKKVMDSWEYDNSRIYFESEPRVIPPDKRLSKGMVMMKTDTFSLPNVEPFTLGIPVQSSTSLLKGIGKSLFGK